MYATKKTIGRQQIWTKAPEDKYADKKIKHNNVGNKRGRKYYCQVVEKTGPASDANETMTRTIWHVASGDSFRLSRKKARLRKSMETQPK